MKTRDMETKMEELEAKNEILIRELNKAMESNAELYIELKKLKEREEGV